MKLETKHNLTAFVRATVADPLELADVLARIEGKSKPTRRDKMITSKEAAEIAGVHKKTIQAWGRRGLLTPRRITRRRVRFSRNELEQFLCETAEE